MTKKKYEEPQITPLESLAEIPKETVDRRRVREYRRCPICYEGDTNGVGICYRRVGSKRYYKCDGCGHTWTATVHVTMDEQIVAPRIDSPITR